MQGRRIVSREWHRAKERLSRSLAGVQGACGLARIAEDAGTRCVAGVLGHRSQAGLEQASGIEQAALLPAFSPSARVARD